MFFRQKLQFYILTSRYSLYFCSLNANFCGMLNYVKTVLTKVSFDARLFEKELRKAIKMLIAEEVNDLRNWCYASFGKQYETILNRCFVF